MVYDTAILGAGAAGLFCGAHIQNRKVAIIEGNEKVGAKLAVSGGGKCNVTNLIVEPKHYEGDESFIGDVFSSYSNRDLLDYLKKGGVVPTLQKRVVENQYFCKTSKELISYLQRENRKNDIYLSEKVLDVKKDDIFIIKTSKRVIKAKKLVLALGGEAVPALGASCSGYDLARGFGHTITKTSPALVGLTLLPPQQWFKELSGLSVDVSIAVDSRVIDGALLFAHKGISGPAVMNSSLYWKKGEISINFLPNHNIEKLLKSSKQKVSNALPLPKRFIKLFLEKSEVRDIETCKLKDEELVKLKRLQNYSFAPAGTFGFAKAEVARGGVNTDEIDPKTLESKLCPGLYIVGELLDVTGQLGGYNLQWAFSTAWICAKDISKTK